MAAPLLCRIAVSTALVTGLVFGKPVAHQGSPGLSGDAMRAPLAADEALALHEVDAGEPQFDTSTATLPPNVSSVAFEGTGTSEFGDLVRLADSGHFVDSVTLTMSSWAIRSNYPGASPLGFSHPITLTLYSVDRTTGVPKAGQTLAALTQTFLIPWRPEPDASSASPLRPWRATNGHYYPGLAFKLTFDLGALGLSLPNEVIFGISFNTHHHGPSPLGVPGPYDALHVGVTDEPPSVGADVEPDAVFWKTRLATHYADAGAAGTGIFRRDTGWTPFRPIARFNNSAYGALANVTSRLKVVSAETARTATALDEAEKLVGWALARSLWDGNNRLQRGSGGVVFHLMAEAVSELNTVASSNGRAATHAQTAILSLVRVAESLAETAIADTLIAGGEARRFALAQDAFDEAAGKSAVARYDSAIDDYGHAWRQVDAPE